MTTEEDKTEEGIYIRLVLLILKIASVCVALCASVPVEEYGPAWTHPTIDFEALDTSGSVGHEINRGRKVQYSIFRRCTPREKSGKNKHVYECPEANLSSEILEDTYCEFDNEDTACCMTKGTYLTINVVHHS